MLLSGAGLLAFALVDLWGTVRDADELARDDANRRAEVIADELRTKLASKEFLDAAPEVGRFQVRDGELVIPAEIGWLDRPPTPYSEARLPVEAWSRIRAARRLEFVEKDREAAARTLAEALTAGGLSPEDKRYLTIEASWQSVRFGVTDSARRMLGQLLDSPPSDAGIAASTVLLARRLGRPEVPRSIRDLCLSLRPEDRNALFDTAEWREKCASVDAKRDVLRTVESRLGALRHGELLDEDRLVVMQGRDGAVEGAVVSADDLRKWNQQVRIHAEARPGAVSVTPSISIEPVVTDAPIWANPVVLIVLLIVLAICFGAGLFFSFRALLRESAAMRSRADFLTSVTHELKTPLSSIRLLSEMLEEGRVGGDAKKREYYRLLAGESARLTVLIENVLDLGRMERGERAYDLRENNVDEVVEEATRVFEPIATRDGLDLTVELGAGARQARVDRGALVQALLNVLDNARKYAMTGGKLEVRSRGENGTYHLSIRDHGPGIDAADREAIFERFARGQDQRDGSIAGVGLGLYLARTILRAHHGDLSCVAPQGGGAEFVFSIPLSEQETK